MIPTLVSIIGSKLQSVNSTTLRRRVSIPYGITRSQKGAANDWLVPVLNMSKAIKLVYTRVVDAKLGTQTLVYLNLQRHYFSFSTHARLLV